MCDALLQCIQAADQTRDAVVQNQYDRLERHPRAEHRKGFITEMLCHLFPDQYTVWNTPLTTWLEKIDATKYRPERLTRGEEYLWIVRTLRHSLAEDETYPANSLAELDHIIWRYCRDMGWLPRTR